MTTETTTASTTTVTLGDTEHFQSVWNAYPAIVRDALKATGHTVVADPIATPLPAPVETVADALPVVNTADLFAGDLLAEAEVPAVEEDKTRIFLNTTIKLGNVEIRVKAAELTSTFHMQNYRDGKPAGENKYMASLVATIEKHGLQAVLDKATISSTITASGNGLEESIDLLDGLMEVAAEAK